MSIEIIPPGSSAVVTERHHDDQGDRYRNHDRFAEVRRDVKDEGARSVDATKDASAIGVTATKDARYDAVLATTTAGSAGVLATTATGAAGVLATKDATASINDQMKVGFTAEALAARVSTDQILGKVEHGTEKGMEEFSRLQKQASDNAFVNQKQSSDNAYNSLGGFKDLTALSYQIQGTNQLEAEKNFDAVQVAAQVNAAAIQLQATTYANAAALQAQQNASAAVLLATQLAAQASKEAAACCCELRTAITFEGQKTRDLINSITEQNLRDRAQRSEAALAAYFAAKVAPTSPIS